jgi:hypothetical protein
VAHRWSGCELDQGRKRERDLRSNSEAGLQKKKLEGEEC